MGSPQIRIRLNEQERKNTNLTSHQTNTEINVWE